MSEDILRRLREMELADVGPALEGSDRTERLLGELPMLYAAALRLVNGFTINQGMNRIFGVREDRHMDIRSWNEEEEWRFAWNGKADSFLMFGETAFGDQYALRRAGDAPGYGQTVYLLDANLLSVEPVFDSFAQFLEREILQNPISSQDPVASECINKFGRLSPTANVVLSPSLMLGGPEDVSNMLTIDSFTAMIYGGDIYAAITSAPEGAAVVGVEPWADDMGRQRLRIRFAE